MNNVATYNNLFIDESGRHYIGDSYTRFFSITGVILNEEERLLANLLLKKWRMKYWNDSLKSFHAVDFFENRKNLRKKELVMKKNFDRASKELLELISKIDFQSRTYYIDKTKARKNLELDEPPIRNIFKTEKEYRKIRKNYENLIKVSFIGFEHIPLQLCIENIFKYHSTFLDENNCMGYINMESQADFDSKFVDTFYKFRAKDNDYSLKIMGINLHNKYSLDAGIELADLISYINFQIIRSQFKIKNELEDVPNTSLDRIREIRKYLRDSNKNTLFEINSESSNRNKKTD